jgi:hypothetical protein
MQIAPDAEQNDNRLEATPFEEGRSAHEFGSLRFSEYLRVHCVLNIFATRVETIYSFPMWLFAKL